MGQQTFAVMLGCPMPEAPKGKKWWGDSEQVGKKWVYKKGLFDIYEGASGLKAQTDEESAIVGFYIAAGASGKRGLPSLEGPIDMGRFEDDKRYVKAIKKAREAWESFAAFCSDQGVSIVAPRLYLVETEVA